MCKYKKYCRNTFITGPVLIMLAALALGGCSRRDEATLGKQGNPLIILLSPAHKPGNPAETLGFMKKHLESSTGMSVEVKMAESQAAAINKFGTDEADAGLVTVEEYLVAREEYGMRAELQVLRGDSQADYEGVILSKTAGKIADLAGKKVGFVGPYSVSGFTLPSIYLKKAGIAFKPVFSATHEENLKKLLDGEIDAAATYARQAERAKGLKILAVTGKVPNGPLMIRRGLNKEKREALKTAFLTMTSTPEGRSALGTVTDITGFHPVKDEVYRPVHDLIRAEGKTVYDLLPGGWEIYRLNLPYTPER